MQNNTYNKKVLLYSGGMDSWLIDKLWKPDIRLYIDMNTRYSKEEMKRLPDDIVIEKLDLSKWEREDKIIPLRNMYLIGIATNYGDEICLGATAGDRVLDKRTIRINLDYKAYTKTELLKQYIIQGGSINEAFSSSFSCYAPVDGHECWNCKPCFRKFIAFALNGYPFPREVIDMNISYIKREILPLIESGEYGRKREEEEIRQILTLYR